MSQAVVGPTTAATLILLLASVLEQMKTSCALPVRVLRAYKCSVMFVLQMANFVRTYIDELTFLPLQSLFVWWL